MPDTTDDFSISVQVNEQAFHIDGMLVMAELALIGGSEPTNQQLIEIVRRCLMPQDCASSISDAQALAIGMRVSIRLQQLGKTLAP